MNSVEYGKDFNDEEIENLLSQFQDENILKLSVNTHRTIVSSNVYNDIQHPVYNIDESGLESDVAARYAKLKTEGCAPKKNGRSQSGKDVLNHNITKDQEKVPRSASDTHPNPTEVDALSADLEARFRALKSQVDFPSSASDSSRKKHTASMPLFEPNSIANSSSIFASSCSSASPSRSTPHESSSSISYGDAVDLIPSNVSHQVNGSFTLQTGCKDESDDDLGVAEADVRKLLKSIRDEVRLEKEDRQRYSRSFQDNFIDEDDSLFDVEEMENELIQASQEEDRLARAAEEVVIWANEAARHSVSENEDGLKGDKNGTLDAYTKDHPQSKQKKKTIWSLFR